jgi:two-component system, chemotaxis family, chemotaxis protein CheY
VRLLIVEDSELIRKVTRLAFPGAKYELEEAENGFGALAQLSLAQQPFDAIVLDLQMPDMNGVDFLRALRQRPLHRDTPVVVATSEGEDSELLKEARRLGVAAVVKKPWKPQELAAAVQGAAAARATAAGAEKTLKPRPESLSEEDVRLLGLAQHGYTFRPSDVKGGDFGGLVQQLRQLRARGLLRLDEGRIMMSQSGAYLMAGPCDLTELGRQALERDRRLGSRR